MYSHHSVLLVLLVSGPVSLTSFKLGWAGIEKLKGPTVIFSVNSQVHHNKKRSIFLVTRKSPIGSPPFVTVTVENVYQLEVKDFSYRRLLLNLKLKSLRILIMEAYISSFITAWPTVSSSSSVCCYNITMLNLKIVRIQRLLVSRR